MLLMHDIVSDKEKIMAVDKDENMLKSCAGTSSFSDDKMRALSLAEGRDKNIKRKRSVGSVTARAVDDGLVTSSKALVQLHACKPHSSSCDGLNFRSSTSIESQCVNNIDENQRGVPNDCNMPRTEVDTVPLSTTRREHPSTAEDGNATNGTAKYVLVPKQRASVREVSMNEFHCRLTRGKASRTPRTSLNSPLCSFSDSPQTSGKLEGWDKYSGNNSSPVLSNNRKRPLPSGTSLPSVTQWGGQRPKKSSRTRRNSVMVSFPSHDDSLCLIERSPSLVSGAETTCIDSPEGLSCKDTLRNPQPRPIVDHSAANMHLGDVSIATEYVNDKGTGNCKGEDFPIEKNGSLKDEASDVVRRHGRSMSALDQSQSHLLSKEKLDIVEMPMLTSGRTVSIRSQSKVVHPSTKRVMNRRSVIQPRKNMGGCSQRVGDCGDDHDELIAAAAYAHYISSNTFLPSDNDGSVSLWEKLRPFFSFVSSDKILYLQDLIKLAVDMDGCFGTNLLTKEDFCHDLAKELSPRQRKDDWPNASEHANHSNMGHTFTKKQNVTGSKKPEINECIELTIPLSQRLLAAIIPENETHSHHNNMTSDLLSNTARDCSDKVSGIVSVSEGADDCQDSGSDRSLPLVQSHDCSRPNNSCDEHAVLSSAQNSLVRSHSACNVSVQTICTLPLSDISADTIYIHNNGDWMQHIDENISGLSPDSLYEHMTLDDKIMLELQSIGIYLEKVPDLDDGEADEIDNNISELKSSLYQQIRKNKEFLCNLDKVVQKQMVHEEKNLEQLALNVLVEMAYGKLMGGRSGRGSMYKVGFNKISKQAALSFAKRVLAQCQKFEDTGKSCFSEPPYRDVLFSMLFFSDSLHSQAAAFQSGPCLQSSPPCTNVVDMKGSFTWKPLEDIAPTVNQHLPTCKTKTSRSRKRELVLGESLENVSSGAMLGNLLTASTQGKRSERDWGQPKDALMKNFTMSGCFSFGLSKGERRKKSKLKQNTVQVTSGNGIMNSAEAQASRSVLFSVMGRSGHRDHGTWQAGPVTPIPRLVSNVREGLDLSNLPLDVSHDLSQQAHDISAWLDVDDDSLQDTELMGLQIPMDDLSELDMNF